MSRPRLLYDSTFSPQYHRATSGPRLLPFAAVRFSLKILVDLLYITGPQAADLLYFGRSKNQQ
jgi:hypothetical protein